MSNTAIYVHPNYSEFKAVSENRHGSVTLDIKVDGTQIVIFGSEKTSEAFDQIAALLTSAFCRPEPEACEPPSPPLSFDDCDIPF